MDILVPWVGIKPTTRDAQSQTRTTRPGGKSPLSKSSFLLTNLLFAPLIFIIFLFSNVIQRHRLSWDAYLLNSDCWEKREWVQSKSPKVCYSKKKEWFVYCNACYATKEAATFTCPLREDCSATSRVPPFYKDNCKPPKCYKLRDKKTGPNIKIYDGSCWEKMPSCPDHSEGPGAKYWMYKESVYGYGLYWYEARSALHPPIWYPCKGMCYVKRGPECTY
jgi:hypothetical protein